MADQLPDREKFNKRVEEVVAAVKNVDMSDLITPDRYQKLIAEVKAARAKLPKNRTTTDRRRMKRYAVVEVREGGATIEKLMEPLEAGKETNIFFMHTGEMYDVFLKAHTATGHGGRNVMEHHLKKQYSNISQKLLQSFRNLCSVCCNKAPAKKKGIVVRPMVFREMNSRCQIDLIDMQTSADGPYKYILNVQDHLTKFVHLRPLESKRAEEVAKHLLDIWLVFGAPYVLQSDNGREFCNWVITSLKELWPELKIVHGTPRHSQSQGSVERANRDVQDILVAWMRENNTTHWAEGLKFVANAKNRNLHSGIKN